MEGRSGWLTAGSSAAGVLGVRSAVPAIPRRVFRANASVCPPVPFCATRLSRLPFDGATLLPSRLETRAGWGRRHHPLRPIAACHISRPTFAGGLLRRAWHAGCPAWEP